MSFPIPPTFLEEEAHRVQENLRHGRRCRQWLWFFLVISVMLNLVFYGLLSLRSHGLWYRQHRRSHEAPSSVFVERYLSGDRKSEHKIAVIRLEGIISSEAEGHVGYDGMVGDLKEEFRLALEDDAIKAIILKIDSPGGEVLASDEIYRCVRETCLKKPVVCSMGSVAASGGYYAAMGSRWIIADNLTITGSIGVIMATLNYKDLFGKIGLKSLVFKSGKFKDLLNGSRDPTPEEITLVQNLVMETYEQFLGIVAKERKLNPDQLRNGIADGRIFSGKQAFELKLIDQIGTFKDAIQKAKNLASIPDAQVLDYVVPFSLSNLLGIFAESHAPKIQLELEPHLFKLQQGKLYYLSFHLF